MLILSLKTYYLYYSYVNYLSKSLREIWIIWYTILELNKEEINSES